MSNCEKFSDLINIYLDTKLDDDDLMELLEHLESCDDCSKLYKDLKSYIPFFKEDDIDYPLDLNERIWDHINKNKDGDVIQFKHKSKTPYLVGLAACIVLGLFVSSEHFIVKFLNINSHEPVVLQAFEESAVGSISLDEAPVTPDLRSFAFNIEHDEYAFVFEFKGNGDLIEPFGEILFANDDILYIQSDNKIDILKSNDDILTKSGFEKISNSTAYNLDTESNFGIYIIYKN